MDLKLALFVTFYCVLGFTNAEGFVPFGSDLLGDETVGFVPFGSQQMEIENSMKLSPSSSSSYGGYWGTCNLKNGNYEEAIELFDEAIADLLNNKGVALYNMGYYDEALDCFEEALEIYQWHPQAKRNRDIAIEMTSQYHGGVDNMNRGFNMISVNLNGVTYTCEQIDFETGKCIKWNPPLPAGGYFN